MKHSILISIFSILFLSALLGIFGLSWTNNVGAQISVDPIVPVTVSTNANIPFANASGEIHYTTTVTNESNQILTGLLVRQNWPSVLLDQGVVAGVTNWTIEALPPKSTETKTFVFTVRQDALPQIYQGSTNLTVVDPSWRLEALYTLDVRAVQILGDALPDTSIPDKLYVLGLFIIIQMSLIATWAFRGILSPNYNNEN